MPTSRSQIAARLAAKICTPALFARLVSQGRWKLAPHLAVLDKRLMDLALGRENRLIVQMPPRHGKSELLGRYLPAWYLGVFPDRHVIYTSYGQKQAEHYGQLAHDVFSQWGPRLFGLQLHQRAAARGRWRIRGREGGMFSVGAHGSMTGKGAHLLIVDDPVKSTADVASALRRDALWDWFHATAMTRLEPGAAVIVNMTRWHDDDLVGRLLNSDQGNRWRLLNFPALCEEPDELGRNVGDALWPQRFPVEDTDLPHGRLVGLNTLRAQMPRHWFEALYQQHPLRELNALWPAAMFERDEQWFDQWPAELPLRVMALDPALGQHRDRGDYAAFVLLGIDPSGHLWIEADLQRGRTPQQLIEDGTRLIARFQPDAFRVEANVWQELLRSQFEAALRDRGLDRFVPAGLHNRIQKTIRIESLDCVIAPGLLHFRRTPGTRLLVEQLREFPTGRHDDGPDALEMAVRTAREMMPDEALEWTTRMYFPETL